MFDDGDDSRRHEAGRSHGATGPGHLRDLHRAPRVCDLHSSAGFGGQDVEALHALAHVDDDFDPVSLHIRQYYDDRDGPTHGDTPEVTDPTLVPEPVPVRPRAPEEPV